VFENRVLRNIFRSEREKVTRGWVFENRALRNILRSEREKVKRGWVFENRALRNIFRPEREKVTRGWRKLCNEELLHNVYSPPGTVSLIR
jgi:hypothetical protein